MRRYLQWIPALLLAVSGATLACPTTDYGDAPEAGTSYPTTNANSGAFHNSPQAPAARNLTLGPTVDCEADGQPSAAADGDGLDEDGITFIPNSFDPGSTTTVRVNVANATGATTAKIDAWCDFGADGSWTAADKILDNVDVNASIAGTDNDFVINVPASTAPNTSIFCRFRLSSAGGLGVTGAATDGEVEDYVVASLPVELMQFSID